MRSKDDIMLESLVIMNKVPGDGKAMVMHEHLFLEAWLDIRDILENRLKSLDNTILKYVIPKEGGHRNEDTH